MPGPLHLLPLGPSDAAAIGALQRELFPPELTEPVAQIAAILRNAERHTVCNLSFGLFEGASLQGYVFAYVESRSLFHDRAEDVVYIKEIALRAGHEGHLRELIRRLLWQREVFTPGMALEAHALADALAGWRGLARLLRFHGLTLAAREEAPQPGRPPYWLMRFDVTPVPMAWIDRALPLPAPDIRHAGMHCMVVRSARQWLSLRQDWQRLRAGMEGAADAPAFDYLWQWWRNFGTLSELHVVVVIAAGEVVGIAPWMLEPVRCGSTVLRRLRPIAAMGSMWCPAALLAADATRCAEALAVVLEANAREWDVLDLAGQADAAWVGSLLAEGAARGWRVDLSCQPVQGVDMGEAGAARNAGIGIAVRRIETWPALEASLAQHGAIESQAGYPGADLPLDEDRNLLCFVLGLARESGRGELRFVQHVAERDGWVIASRFGVIGQHACIVLRAASLRGAEAARAAECLEQAELAWLREQGVARVEYVSSSPKAVAAQARSTLRLRFWQPGIAPLQRRQRRRERLAALIDAIAVRGAGRGIARRLRGG